MESHQMKLNLLQPKAVFFTCMDSRMLPTRFTQTKVGDMFIGKLLFIIFKYRIYKHFIKLNPK